MNFFIDTETSGLANEKDYKNLEKYDKCRIVSISWLVTQHETIIEQSYYIIKPDNFIISDESYNIHGISQEEATNSGNNITEILDLLYEALEKCNNIVAHNIKFDINVLLSESFRYNKHELIDLINSKHQICTMLKGKSVMNLKKFPKLSELYKFLYNEEMVNAHNALVDTKTCYLCYIKMFPIDKSFFFFRNKQIKLTVEQQKIVYEDLNTNVCVLASAGSGKTTTMLCRIKYLLKHNILEKSIILTAFNYDAACEIKEKMFDILGYKSDIKIGTIDAISKYFTELHNPEKKLKHVSEYSQDLYNLLKQKPEIIKKYKYLFIDEFQDINEIQFNIINEFYKNGVKIYCVGDDYQNIYSFRGSDVQYILNFNNYFNNSKKFFLTQNFRSTSNIVNFANGLLNYNKIMTTNNKENYEKPTINYFEYDNLQANYVLNKIEYYLNNNLFNINQIAILSPINQNLYLIESLLTKNNINNIFLESSNDIRTQKNKDGIILTTIHKAKGLEWDVVFLINSSDNLLPKLKDEKNINDSRKLLYVAITRPKKLLHISYVANINKPYVSRYIKEIPQNLYNFINFDNKYFGENDIKYKNNMQNIDDIKIDNYKLFNNFNYTEHKLIDAAQINLTYILKENIYNNFLNFIELYIYRIIGLATNTNDYIKDIILYCEYGAPKALPDSTENNIKNIIDINLENKLILEDLWNISLIKTILLKNRTNLLYKEIDIKKIYDDNFSLFNNIDNNFKNYITNLLGASLALCTVKKLENINLNFKLEYKNFFTIINVLINDILILFSFKNNINKEDIIKLYLQHYICEKNNYKINQLFIYNPFRFTIYKFEIDNIDIFANTLFI